MKKSHIIHLLKSIRLLCFFIVSANTSFALAQNPKHSQKVKDSLVQQKKTVVKTKRLAFNGADGPYIINDTLYRVTSDNKFITQVDFSKDSVAVYVDNSEKDEFYFTLNSKFSVPKSSYPDSNNITVISDIEGKYDAFAGFLYANKIIDKNNNWIYGNGHLVLVGDFVDRGKNVTQVLWLIYKLDQQAKEQGGHVHFILGNHEVFNFHGHHRYNRGKYIKVAQAISGINHKQKAVKHVYSKQSELGKWLATKNVIEKIGDYVFVHAGLSPELLKYQLNFDELNTLVRSQFEGFTMHKNDTINYLYGSKGPFWYRGLVTSKIQYSKIKQRELDDILNYYNAKKVVIGHTVVKNISTAYNGKVIRLDVGHGTKKFSGKTKGLLIENGCEFIIDDKGNRTVLQN